METDEDPGASAEDSASLAEQDSSATSAHEAADPILTLAEAARTVGLSERALRKHIHRGKLRAERIERGGRSVAAVSLSTLRETYGTLVMVPETGSGAAGPSGPGGASTRLRSTREIAQAKQLRAQRAQQVELAARLAKLRGLLGMERAQRREMARQMQYIADRAAAAERRLELSQKEVQALSVQLGQAQGRVEVLAQRAQLLPRQELAGRM